MLVAALEYLAAEFEQRVLKPVAALKHPRSWRSDCWSSCTSIPRSPAPARCRCGTRSGARRARGRNTSTSAARRTRTSPALVRELTASRLARQRPPSRCDGVALGLIGVLEVLWQGIAFQSETSLNRRALVARALATCARCSRDSFPRPLRRGAAADAEHAAGRPPERAQTSYRARGLSRTIAAHHEDHRQSGALAHHPAAPRLPAAVLPDPLRLRLQDQLRRDRRACAAVHRRAAAHARPSSGGSPRRSRTTATCSPTRSTASPICSRCAPPSFPRSSASRSAIPWRTRSRAPRAPPRACCCSSSCCPSGPRSCCACTPSRASSATTAF